MIIYLDGSFVSKEDAKVSVFDHGLLYGDGVFEGIRAYNGRVFRLDEHLQRLYDSAKAIMLTIPLTQGEMEGIVLDTIRRNGLRDAYVRLVVTRGVGDLGLGPEKCPRASVFCIAGKIALYPEKYYEQGLEVVTVPTRRNIAEALNPRIKSLNYLNNILAKIEGQIAGVPEAIMLNQEGYVVECTGDNIFVVRDGALLTPPSHVGALEGITRNVVLGLAAEQGMPTKQTLFTRYEVYTADECFLTGTAAELIPVVMVDRRVIGDGLPGSVTRKLTEAFRELTQTTGTPIG
ncbi:branched-chain-amino-acid transaminase [Candidatus Poribacteria bacterium]|nr:branched-chain-amino-acid transaminase [Candidatus Poribacteria bacterium]